MSDGGAAGSGGSGGDLTCQPGVPATSQVPRMLDSEYDNVVRDLLGVTTLASTNQPPSYSLLADSPGDITSDAWRLYLSVADEIASSVMSGTQKTKFISCDPAATPSCLSDTVKSFGRKAFRRPLTDTEVSSFLRLTSVSPQGTPDEIAEAILYTFLASPSFIMLPELGSDKEGDAIKLTSYEVATRLSFLLWNSVPDDTLNAAADSDQLQTKDQILAQAERMLKDPRAQTGLIAFGRYYLGTQQQASHWGKMDHDSSVYPQFSTADYVPLLGEIDSFFSDVAFGGGAFKDLFLSNVGFVDRDTAPLYGLDPSKYGTDLTRVTLDANQRPGFLTRVGFLSSYSHYATTSSILRGAFITLNVLGIDTGTPPVGANQTPLPAGNYTTERQVEEAVTAGQTCAGCHANYLNPPGYVLEHYDAIGGWQDTDPLGGAIDGAADVIFTADAMPQHITSPLELMQAIAVTPGAQHHFCEQMVAYASGRTPNPSDACTVDVLANRTATGNYPIASMFSDYTQTDAFRLRTVGVP
jgi:hypothetical protein